MASDEQEQLRNDARPSRNNGQAAVTEPPSPPVGSAGSASIWSQIKRHKVVEWSLAYIAFGYAALHASQMLRETFGWSLAVPRFTLFTLLLGLPIAITLAWYQGHLAQHRVSRIEISILASLLVIAGSVLWFFSNSTHERPLPYAATPVRTSSSASQPLFAPPAHSVAVLPFTNLSGDPKQEYFSDGMTEELINALTHIDALQVVARTSSFSFKGQNADIGTIARKLNVSAVLEGSIRRSGHTVRVTAQLIDSVTGYHQWSEDYDRSLKDVLALQTEIATAIAQQLRAELIGNEGRKIKAGGTSNPQAYDAYLLGSNLLNASQNEQQERAALVALDRAIAIDGHFAAAYARRADALVDIVVDTSDTRIYQAMLAQAARAAETAIALAPDYADAYAALAVVHITEADFRGAQVDLERALALNPGSARIQFAAGSFESRLGHHDRGIQAAQRAVSLDPNNYWMHVNLMQSLFLAHRYSEALRVAVEATPLNPRGPAARGVPTLYYLLGEPAKAKQLCESPSYAGHGTSAEHYCLALADHAAGEPSKAEIELQKFMTLERDSDAEEYAGVYAQWGDVAHALDWIEKAEQVHDPALQALKVDPMIDPIRTESRFKAVEQRLNFPP